MHLLSYLKNKISLIAFCNINSLILLAVTFAWINKSHIVTDDEELLIKNSISTKIRSGARQKSDSTRFLFINLSWEKQLIDVTNANGQVIGKRAITNRKRIAKFLEYVNKNPNYKFILLDVWFKDSSDYHSDSLLQVQFNKTKNFLIPYHKNDMDDNKKDSALFKAPSALSDYEKDDFENNFTKFRLVQGNHFKTTPLVMYEKIHHQQFNEGTFWQYMGNQLSMNSIILDFRIWNEDLVEKEHGNKIWATYCKAQLADFLNIEIPKDSTLTEELRLQLSDNLRANLIHRATKDKIIVIGDLEDADIHQTLYGPTAGPLILLNVFLALENGDNLISLWFLLFLFTGYFLISFKCYTSIDILDQYLIQPLDKYFIGKVIPKTNFRDFILGFMGHLIYFIILSIISYFLFNIHLTILLLAIYMEILDWALNLIRNKRNAKIFVEKATTSTFIT